MKHKDVYAYGIICPSRLIVLKGGFPKPGHYAEMKSVHYSMGGEAANTSIVLASLNIKVKLDGNWLEDNETSQHSLDLLSRRHINTSRIRRKHFCGPDELVIASGKARTIFGKYGSLHEGGRKWNEPHASDIKATDVVCLDPFLGRESLKVSRWARAYHVPYVTVDGKYSDEIIRYASIAVISDEFRQRSYPGSSSPSLFRKYQKNCKGLVVFTSGDHQILYGKAAGPLKTYRPPHLIPIDTSGAGDSFRAGMIFGTLKKWPEDYSIQFAAALAGLNCLRFPGVLDSPGYREVLSFMRKRKY